MVSFILLSFSQKNKKPKPLFDVKKVEKAMKYIPDHRFLLESKIDNKTMNVIRIFSDSIVPFYMSDHEVSNLEYRNFLTSIIALDTQLYKTLLPDTNVWRGPLNYSEPYFIYYFRHPAFNDYPVIGVSYEQSIEYCKWLTKNYLLSKSLKFKNVQFNLPSKNQWIAAAAGNNNYVGLDINLINSKGQYTSNFRAFSQSGIMRKDSIKITKKDSSIYDQTIYLATSEDFRNFHFSTTPTKSYPPNSYGIYNMRGNVEEFVLEKGISKGGSWKDPGYYLQNLSEETYDTAKSASAERGFRVAMNFIK